MKLVTAVAASTLLALVACASPAASTGPSASPTPTEVSIDCTNSNPCTLPPGTYDTGTSDRAFHPGMTLTLTNTWGSHSLDIYEFSLYPSDHPDDRLFFWEDMVAVKSSGAGHGTTILDNVGTTPRAMMAWITGNPDFDIVAPPTPVTSVDGIKATRVVLVISHTARYGDPSCPANPRCADLFTRRDNSEYYSIGGTEEIRLDIAAIKIDGRPHTLFIVLDAGDHAKLQQLAALAQPVIDSVRLHAGVTAG
jgi:hypothetical protein